MSKITIPQLEELLAQDRSGRMTGEILQRVLENPDSYNPNFGHFGRIFKTTVNFDLALPGLLKFARQDWVSNNFTPTNFHIGGKGIRTVGLELYEFDHTVTGPQGVEIIEADGYQLEGPAELCAFIAVNPMAQLRRPIVAWKTRWQDSRGHVCVPAAQQGAGRRELILTNLEGDFVPYWCVLVSRKAKLG